MFTGCNASAPAAMPRAAAFASATQYIIARAYAPRHPRCVGRSLRAALTDSGASPAAINATLARAAALGVAAPLPWPQA